MLHTNRKDASLGRGHKLELVAKRNKCARAAPHAPPPFVTTRVCRVAREKKNSLPSFIRSFE